MQTMRPAKLAQYYRDAVLDTNAVEIVRQVCIREDTPGLFEEEMLGVGIALRQMIEIQDLDLGITCHGGGLGCCHVAYLCC